MGVRRGLVTAFVGGLLTLVSCGPHGPFLRVQIDNIPVEASTLSVHTLLKDRFANQEPVFALNGSPTFSIGLILNEPASGQIAVSAGAVDSAGCLRAIGDSRIAISANDTTLEVHLPLTALTAPICQTDAPVVLGTEPVEISTSGRNADGVRGLDIIGWGFRPGAQVTLSGRSQCASLSSYQRLHIDSPVVVQPPGPARIEVTLPGQPAAVDDTHLLVNTAPVTIALSTPQQFAPSSELIDAAVGNFPPDRKPTVVVLDDQGRAWLYRGAAGLRSGPNGLIGDASGPLFTLPGFQFGQTGVLAMADVDGDGAAEIGAVSTVGSFVYRWAGTGMLDKLVESPARFGRDTAFADLDGDGRPEWLIAGTDLRVYKNPGDGRFGVTESQRVALPTAAITVVDLDGDSALDVVAVAAPPAAFIRVLYNRGGVLTAAQDYTVRACPSAPQPPQVVAARLDDDDLPDLAINGSPLILLNRGGSFEYRYISGVSPCFGGTALGAADLNEDGAIDLAWLNSDGLTILMNTGAARFGVGSQTQGFAAVPSGSGITFTSEYHRLLKGDVNGDGAMDLLFGPHVFLAGPRTSSCP